MKQYAIFVLTALSALSAAFAQVPYGWAHIAATAIGAAAAVISGGAGVAIIATQKANTKNAAGQATQGNGLLG